MILLKFCAACGDANPDHLNHHHLVPRSCGGTDDPSNLITLCRVCHGKMHGVEWSNNLRTLIKVGRDRAIANGVKMGRKQIVLEFDGREQSIESWAKETGQHPDAIRRRLERGWSVEMALTTPKQDKTMPRQRIRSPSANNAVEGSSDDRNDSRCYVELHGNGSHPNVVHQPIKNFTRH